MSDLMKELEQLKKDINDKLEKYELLKQEYKITGIVPEGMITCPKCGELLFEEAEICPECKCTLNSKSSTTNISLNNNSNNPNPNIVINNMSSSSSSSSASASNSNVVVRTKRKRSKFFDFFMFNATGGLWTIWMLIRPKDK